MVRKLFLIILITISFTFSFAQEIKVTASTDTTDYLIGDHIKYTLLIEAAKNVYIINPFFRDSLKNVDVISMPDPIIKENEKTKTIKYEYTLSRFDSAQVNLPPIVINYRVKGDTTLKTAISNPVTFNVHTLKVSVQEEIKDIKQPVRLPFNWTKLIIWIVIIIFVLVVLYILYKKYWKKKEIISIKPREVKLLPYQLALQKLDQLGTEKLWQKGFVKEYHSRITEIIREYFEKQFNLPALELTTTESLQLLKKHVEGKKIIDITSDFLNNADLVKFAKFTPLESINLEMMNQAKEIVSRTIPANEKVVTEEVVNV